MGEPIEEQVVDTIAKLEATVHVLTGNLAPIITPAAKKQLAIIQDASAKLYRIAAKLGWPKIILENIDALTTTITELNKDLYSDLGPGYSGSASFIAIGSGGGSGDTIVVNDTVDHQLHRVNDALKMLILENESTTRTVRGLNRGIEKEIIDRYNKKQVPKPRTLVERYNTDDKKKSAFSHRPE